jgi:cytochrome c oxidase subunit 2
VETANELHIPVGEPVKLEIESADVIHSVWIPQLHGKMDAIPTRVNDLVLQADTTGTYRGECAEYCGLQHAHMGFMVVAESREDFDAWIAHQQQPAPQAGDGAAQRGQQVFLNGGCTFCHTIRGLDDSFIDASQVDLGPDLTHIYSRLTIAGATLTTNRGNLAGWIIDAQHVKPGSLMPPTYLNSQDLQDLLAYLEALT